MFNRLVYGLAKDKHELIGLLADAMAAMHVDQVPVAAVKVSAAGAGPVVVNVGPGKVHRIRATVAVSLCDDTAVIWPVAANTEIPSFTPPVQCVTNITIAFSAAGDAYIQYL